MRALSKVAEWLLPEPKTCSVIACENGIVSDAGPEALSLASNVGEPAAYKLIRMWQARQLSISRLREALLRHHHNAAAAELEPFCHDASMYLTTKESLDPSLEPVPISSKRAVPVYITGSRRECSTKVYEVMTRGETTSNMQDEGSIHSQQLSLGEDNTFFSPTATTPPSDPPSLVITTAESSTLGQQQPRTLASFGRQSTSNNSPSAFSASHKTLVSGSHVSVRSIDSTSSHRSVTDEDRKLLDALSSHVASETPTLRHIEEGPVFPMVPPASKDRSKLTSPSTPLTDTPLGTPGRTYSVYFAGSSRECSTKVYEVMMVPKEDNSHSFYCEISDSDREETSTIDSGVISSRSSELGSHESLNSIDSTNSLVISVEKPSLLTTTCVNDDWNPLPSFTHTPESLDNCGKFVLQNINFRQLQEENITLCPLQEQLYLKPNTICVYSIDLEELTLSPHTSFTRLYEFLCFFHLRHNPKGMQVILVGAYDSSTEYGSTLDDAGLDWFCSRIPELLQDKHINELLFEDRTKSRIHLIPFDLANPKKGTASLQDVIKECIKKYHLRVEATTDDNQKIPQSLKQWPLFLGKVMELSSSQPLISKEDLKRLASSVLWNDGGQLFDQCLECLYQSSLLQTNGEYGTPKCMSCDCVFIITLVLTHRSRCRQWSLDKSRPHCEGDSTTW